MSADNWTTCPRCVSKHRQDVAAAQEAVRLAYGTVDETEYLRLKTAAIDDDEPGDTLREDYDIGIFPDTAQMGRFRKSFGVSYSCLCEVCKFKWSYEAVIPLADIPGATDAA